MFLLQLQAFLVDSNPYVVFSLCRGSLVRVARTFPRCVSCSRRGELIPGRSLD